MTTNQPGTETPRCDALENEPCPLNSTFANWHLTKYRDFARTLERELIARQAELETASTIAHRAEHRANQAESGRDAAEEELTALRHDIESLTRTASVLATELAAAKEELTVLHDPAKWMRWCDIRVLERAEAAEAKCAAAAAVTGNMMREYTEMRDKCVALEREAEQWQAGAATLLNSFANSLCPTQSQWLQIQVAAKALIDKDIRARGGKA